MKETEHKPLSPKVFVSYSHDSEQHKDWVRQLSERLRSDGVDILLDQWEIGPGDDVTHFMELALSSCHRVLIICTEGYIRKANTLKGGVGYERMIITAEIAKHLKTRKFIPILRNVQLEELPKFLGPRICVDLRRGELDQTQYDILLRTLLDKPKHKKPPLGQSPYSEISNDITGKSNKIPVQPHNGTAINSSILYKEPIMKTNKAWHFHWHRAVHEYCGYKLYLIFVRFSTGSIFLKESVISDLRWAQVSNFMIFHLYSDWDILIRIWADDETIQRLRNRFIENSDIHKDYPPEYLIVQELTHFPETDRYSDIQDVSPLLNEIGLAHLEDVQDKGQESSYFERLKNAGLILDETVGFHPERIQFYITIRSLYALELSRLARMKELIAESEQIRNRSIYITAGSAIRLVVKGQVENYYGINSFLQAITKELASVETITQTMLVASPEVRMSTYIDFDRSDKHIIDHEIQARLPEISSLRTVDRLKLTAQYVEIRPKLTEDKQNILIGLLQAKARENPEEISRLLSFFPTFEDKLRQQLVPTLVRLYGDWQVAVDELKSKEGVGSRKVEDLTFGDLCKLYKRVVLEKRNIDIATLSDDEFCSLMDAAPVKRNQFAHKQPDLRNWDDLFSFCSAFVPIYSRLLADISSQ